MSKKLFFNFLFLLLIPVFKMQASVNQDSLLKIRQDVRQIYDSAHAAMEDTTLLNLQRVLRAAEELVRTDDQVMHQLLLPQKSYTDSIVRQLTLLKTEQINLDTRNKSLNDWILYTGGGALVLLVTGIVFLIIIAKRRSRSKSLKQQISDQDHMITEYRKRINELLADLENARKIAQDQLIEINIKNTEITELSDNLRKLNDGDRNSDSIRQILEERVQKYKDDLEKEYAERKEIERTLQNVLNRIRAGS